MKTNQVSAGGPPPGYGPAPTPRANRRRAHISTARAGLLGVLIDQPEPCTVRALAALTRQHPNTIREHLDGLVDDQLAVRTRAPAQSRGRPAWLYSAAPEVGTEPGAREYAGLASALAGQIARTSRQPRADSIDAGREWGRALVRRSPVSTPAVADRPAAADEQRVSGAAKTHHQQPAVNRAPSAMAARREVVTLLEELGFAPSADARLGVVKLHRCPLLQAAHQNPEVVCGVHLGLVRGALDELGAAPDQSERTALQPFSEPGACRLDLLPRRGSTG